MDKIVQNIPFLRITVALIAGILIADNFTVNNLIVAFVIGALFTGLLLLNRLYQFKVQSLFGAGISLLFGAIGILIFNLYNQQPIFYNNKKFAITVLEKPVEKQNSYKTIAKVLYAIEDKKYLQSSEKLMVYFGKNKRAANLRAGDVIVMHSKPTFIKNNGNPFEFDYAKYLRRNKIYRQVYCRSKYWTKTGLHAQSFKIIAENLREKLLKIYQKQQLSHDELDILSALTLGYKRELDDEIKQVFIRSGAMHILAVSGLHVSILYLSIAFAFKFLRRYKYGRAFLFIISFITLWAFAFITGLSPSVSRAATMFSILAIANSLERNSNIYNTLLASGFLLLLINPNNIFSVGFQLSYTAVMGIVFLQPRLQTLFIFENKIERYVWGLITVSIAAQIATFPLTSYYFNIFPTYFFLTNIFIIPAITLLIPLSLLLLIVSKIPYLSTFIAYLVIYLTKFMYWILKEIESLPYSNSTLTPNTYQFILILISILSIFIFIKNKKIPYLRVALSSIVLFFVLQAIRTYKTKNQQIMIVYNHKESPIHLISGKENYIFGDDDGSNYHISNTLLALHLNNPTFISSTKDFTSQHLIIRDGLIFFNNQLISTNKKYFSQVDYFIKGKKVITNEKPYQLDKKGAFYHTFSKKFINLAEKER